MEQKKNYEKYEVRAHTDTRTNGYIRHCKTRTRIVVNITVYQHNDIITMMLPIEYILLGFYIFAVFYLSIIPYPPETNRATGSSRRRFYYFRSLSSRNSSYPHPVHSRSITFHWSIIDHAFRSLRRFFPLSFSNLLSRV